DDNPCTADHCRNGACSFEPIAGCCRIDSDCDDGNSCTQDACSAGSGAALSFDGIDDRVTMGRAPGLGAAAFTLECWLNWNGKGATSSSGTGGVVGIPLVTKG